MVTQRYNNSSVQIMYLMSSDPKPTDGVDNGSVIIEVDTGKEFRFDKENLVWYDFGYTRVMI